MAGRRRVLAAGGTASEVGSVADSLSVTELLSATVETVDDPADASSVTDLPVPADADTVVWVGETTADVLAALVERADEADLPVVLFGGDDAPGPAAAFAAGVADFVRADEGGEAVLARRLAGGDTAAQVTADGGGSSGSGAVGATGVGDRHGRDGDGGGVPERAERVLDRIDEAVIGLDEDLRVSYANARVEEILGRPAAAFVGEEVWSVFPEAEGTAFEREYRAALERQEVRTFETRVPTYDAWFEGTVYPAPDGLTVYVRDVTDHRHAEAELERNERALRDLQRLASDRGLSLTEKLDRALEVGCDRLDLPLGFVTRIDDGTQTIVAARGDDEHLQPGSTAPLSEAYCRKAIEGDELLALEHAVEEGWAADPAYERFGLECYLGGKLLVGGDTYGTLCFAATERRDRDFSAAERTFIELLVEWVSYELERRERERDLERYETIVRSVDDGVYELDAEGRFTYVNPAFAALTGYAAADLLGEHSSVVWADATGPDAALAALLDGEATERTVEATVRRDDGGRFHCEDSMTALRDDDGAVRGVVGIVRDVTEQRAHREMLSDLLASSRSLMQSRDREEVSEVVARAVKNVLGFELNVVRLFDSETDRLVPAGTTEDVTERLQDPPTFDIGEGGPGRAFVDGETVVVDDTADLDDDYERRVVRSAMHLPMGVHGTISIGAEEPDAFSDVDRRAAELVATSAAAAANRAKREREVRDARQRVDTLVDRINGLIEDTVEVLVQAGTREELEAGVVEQLVATEPYAFAWIGRPDLTAETVEVAAWDGDADLVADAPDLADAVEGLSVDRAAARADADPAVLAIEDDRIRVVDDLCDASEGSVHARAREAGLGSLIAVPLTYKEANYGVLVVYASDPAAFAEREQVVLSALGRAVANAVNAIESGRILSTDRVVELEFTVRDADLLFGRLSAQSDAALELTGSVYESEGRLRLYVTASGTDAETVRDLVADDADVESFGVIADHDGEVLFEATVADSLVSLLADHGAVTRAVTAEDGVVRYTIELPYEAEARDVFSLVEERYDATDLVGYHEHERPVRTRQEFHEAVLDRFTDRQETAVRTAHLGGFFEWPREIDGDDLAESMDISRPTYHQHLRAAQRKLFEELFDPGSSQRE